MSVSASRLLASEVRLCAGDPGTGQGAGRSAGLSGSHALGKFPGYSPLAGSSLGPTDAHAPHRSRGEGMRCAGGRRPETSAGRASPRPGQGRSLPRAPSEREATYCPLSVPATEGSSPAVSPGADVERAMASAARPGSVPARRTSAAVAAPAAPAARPALRRPRPPLLSLPPPPRGTARPAPRAVVTCSARARLGHSDPRPPHPDTAALPAELGWCIQGTLHPG